MNIADRVYFTGMIAHEQIPSYLATADVFVMPSAAETFGLSVVEALAAGLPALGIESPGVGDVVEDGCSGFLTQEVDLALYTAKMVRLVTEKSLRRKMSLQAQQAAQAYSIEIAGQQMLDRYQYLVTQSAKRKRKFMTRLLRWIDWWRWR